MFAEIRINKFSFRHKNLKTNIPSLFLGDRSKFCNILMSLLFTLRGAAWANSPSRKMYFTNFSIFSISIGAFLPMLLLIYSKQIWNIAQIGLKFYKNKFWRRKCVRREIFRNIKVRTFSHFNLYFYLPRGCCATCKGSPYTKNEYSLFL